MFINNFWLEIVRKMVGTRKRKAACSLFVLALLLFVVSGALVLFSLGVVVDASPEGCSGGDCIPEEGGGLVGFVVSQSSGGGSG